MNRVTINTDALHHNIRVIDQWMSDHGATWTLVTKVLCGHQDTLRALDLPQVLSVGDSRLDNLRDIKPILPYRETWYLRLPRLSTIHDIVTLSDVSLNSERRVIEALNEGAGRQGKIHKIVVMIELGDLREGILPGSLMTFYNNIFQLPNINVIGIGANIGCLSGAMPSIDQLMQLILYRELLELKFDRKLPLISAGATVMLPLLLQGQLPKTINHFRIGEAVFLGTSHIHGEKLDGLRDDAIILEAEICELIEKSYVPMGETSSIALFETIKSELPPVDRRGFRALVAVGQVDTQVSGLVPLNPEYKVAGASSDLTVVNLGRDPGDLAVGKTIKFMVNYPAFLRLMMSKYVEKVVTPSVDSPADGQ
jgi:ornithine racemase